MTQSNTYAHTNGNVICIDAWVAKALDGLSAAELGALSFLGEERFLYPSEASARIIIAEGGQNAQTVRFSELKRKSLVFMETSQDDPYKRIQVSITRLGRKVMEKAKNGRENISTGNE